MTDKKDTIWEKIVYGIMMYCMSDSPKFIGRKFEKLSKLRKLEYYVIKQPLLLTIYFFSNLPYRLEHKVKPYIVRKYYHTKWWYLEKFHGKRKLRVDD